MRKVYHVGMDFFRNLFRILFPPRKTEKLVDALTLETVRPLLSPQTTVIGNASVVALLPHRHSSVHALIVEAKFYRNVKAIEMLGTLLGEYVKEHMDVARTILIPIPLGKKRREKRGYNQMEELAYAAGRQLEKLKVSPQLLIRIKDTVRQTSLKKQDRLQNMKDAFTAPNPLDPEYLYIVLDDVLTTGATLAGGINAIQQAGAREINGIALAYSSLK